MSANLRTFPPSRDELRDYCYEVLKQCPECSTEPYQIAESDFAPCEMCAALIDAMLTEFNDKLVKVIPVVKACATCRPRIDAELGKGLALYEQTTLCEACSTALAAIYGEGLN